MQHPGFDELAAQWDDDPVHVDRAHAVARALIDRIDLQGAHVIEDGCGTGLLGFALLERAELGTLTFIDPSPGMREVVAEKIAALAPRRACVLAPEEDPGSARDLVASVMVLHHVPDPRATIARWTEWLAPGGHLAVADLHPEDGSFHGPEVDDVHRGFDPAEVGRWMDEAGLDTVHSGTVYEIEKVVDDRPRTFPVWLVLGRRRGEAS